MKKIYEVIIVGAGAAGLFCGAFCGTPALILERGGAVGRKLAISGGGKANFSNLFIKDNFICHPDADFCDFAISRFDTNKLLDCLRKWNLPHEQKERGRLFLKCKAGKLAARLQAECLAHNSRIITNQTAREIRPGAEFMVATADRTFYCRKLVLALGSPARPKLALCSNCWELAAKLGHTVRPPVPALTPLLYGAPNPLEKLAGISAPVVISLANSPRKFADDLLFTHQGLSGPAVLQASLFWRDGQPLHIDFLPGASFEKLLDLNEASTPGAVLKRKLPDRLAAQLIPPELAGARAAELSRKTRKHLGGMVNARQISGLKRAGFNQAEVALGGVATNEIDPRTMQSRLWPNLYILGEMADVTGMLGGYNLHWAFASAWLAAGHISRKP